MSAFVDRIEQSHAKLLLSCVVVVCCMLDAYFQRIVVSVSECPGIRIYNAYKRHRL